MISVIFIWISVLIFYFPIQITEKYSIVLCWSDLGMVGGSQEPGTEQAKEGEAQADKDVLGGDDWDQYYYQ